MAIIDEAILNKHGFITYNEIQMEMQNNGVFVAISQVYNDCQSMGVYEESSYVKPKLTDRHRNERLLFVLNKIDASDQNNLVYHNHHNIVSIDENTDPIEKTL
jgi:hypothetical protein